MGRNVIYNDGLNKWQRYRLRLKEKNIINGHNKSRTRTREKRKEYNSTPKGRALYLVCGYRASDIKHNRGECTLNADWIINNIFNSQCIYCGETDWKKLGCDRIDNTKAHTEDNVVPCCKHCNDLRQKQPFEEFYKKMKGLTSPS